MTKQIDDDPETPALAISTEKVCFFIIKAREFDVKEANTDENSGSNATDDRMIDVLEDNDDDSVIQELAAFIAAMSEDERIDLVALAWLGRDDNSLEDWNSLRAEATRAHSVQATRTANYLLGMPLVSDYLEEALSLFGRSCEDVEINRL
jgi:hypothetical protein